MQFEYQETTQDLKTRIEIHQKYGSRDIDAWMLELLKPRSGFRILDVGCGSGKQLLAFHNYLHGAAEITGGDVNNELLEQARALNAEMGSPWRILKLDFNDRFPCESEEFDLVSCCFALYYAADFPFTIGEMHRVLKPGGRLFTTGPMPENKQLFYDVIREATGQPIPPMPGSSRYGSEILEAIRSQFGRVELQLFENPLNFDAVEPFLAYVRASLSEDRKLWKPLFQTKEDFDRILQRIAIVAGDRLQSEGKLVMVKVIGGFIASK